MHAELLGGHRGIPPRKISCLEVDSGGFWEVSHYHNTTLIHVKLVKTRLRSRISDSNLPKFMHIAIEGPELSFIDFNKILDVFKESNRRTLL